MWLNHEIWVAQEAGVMERSLWPRLDHCCAVCELAAYLPLWTFLLLRLQKGSMLIVAWKQVCEVGIIHPFYLWGCWGSKKLSTLLWSLSSEGGINLGPRVPWPCRNFFPFCCYFRPSVFWTRNLPGSNSIFPPHSRILVRVARLSFPAL